MKIAVNKLKENPNNPRVIRDANFKKLVSSIKSFPEMLSVRKIVVNNDYEVLGGNMRLKALKEAGVKEVEIEVVDWPIEKQKEFIIKDNVSFGEWNYELLANEWEYQDLTDWGLTVPGLEKLEGDTALEDFFLETEKPEGDDISVSVKDDGYSRFELIMFHDNKKRLMETLNKIKQKHDLEKLEDALMELVFIYEKYDRG
jgi:hypothetical protein